MPFNGSGVFTSVYNWQTDAANGLDITASRFDTQESDYTTNGFGNCLTRDGQGYASQNLPMNTYRHINVGNAVAVTDYAAAGQIQSNAILFAIGAGTGDAITATYAPVVASLVDGMQLDFRSPGTNATTTPTFAPNGLTAHTITKFGGQALAVGDIQNAQECSVRYVSASTRWEMLSPNQSNTGVSLSANNIWTGTQTFGVASNTGKLIVSGNTSGSMILAAPATGGGTVTFFAGSDTVVALAVAQALTNKTYEGMTISASSGTFTLANSKTLTVSNSMTLTATDGSTLAIGSGGTLASAAYSATGTSGATIPLLNGNVTFSGNNTYSGTSAVTGIATFSKAVPAIGTTTTNTTITPTGDSTPQYNVTALHTAATIAVPSGTPTDGQPIVLRIIDDGTARALTWASGYAAIGVTLPTTTVLSKYLYVGCKYNAQSSKWDVLAVGQQ